MRIQKKIYTNTIDIEEVLQRLNRGEKVYSTYDTSSKGYHVYKQGMLLSVSSLGKVLSINSTFNPSGGDHYFIDEEEVEESQATLDCVGKLCRFWNGKTSPVAISILACIDDKGFFRTCSNHIYTHCRPLTQKEALDLVK